MLFNIVNKRLFSAVAAAKPKAPKALKPTGMHALSPYIMYVTEQMKVDSGKDVKSRMQEIAKQWNSLNPTQKKKYETLSVKEKENRIQEFAKLSQEEQEKEVANAKETRQERAQRKERKERRQLWEESGHPERPPTGLNLFVKEQFDLRKKRNEKLSPVTEHLKNFASQWQTMSVDGKRKYEEESQKLRDAYKTAVGEWQKTQKAKAREQKIQK